MKSINQTYLCEDRRRLDDEDVVGWLLLFDGQRSSKAAQPGSEDDDVEGHDAGAGDEGKTGQSRVVSL